MELWGGVECTVNRVGDRYRDQTVLTGHQDRIGDLALVAGLGVKALRYPVLWERVAPDRPDDRDWRWTDERVAEIGRLGMRAIPTLVHHGSGPAYTSLVFENFAPLFTAHARAAAERYGHLDEWTPVNEPLTTARFSALYGHWYPHARDERSFWTALLNQVDATRGAMRAIRAVNPAARLVQTEDLGRTYAVPELGWLADLLNERRWLSWDLLAGLVTPGHSHWEHAAGLGFEDRLRAIADDPCPPDVVGINFYPTSERFLDHRDRYPDPVPEPGYHDFTALRVLDPPPAGLAGLLREAWARYRRPIAVTECHLGCTREEQLRWLAQCWAACLEVRAEGADVRAMTGWALFGGVDWDSLLTEARGSYEPGAFEAAGGGVRPTAVAAALAALGRGEAVGHDHPLHPVMSGEGWWQRDCRLEHPPVAWAAPADRRPEPEPEPTRPLLVVGAGAAMGEAFAGACGLRGLPHLLLAHPPDASALALEPWAVVDARGVADAALAGACADRGVRHLALTERAAGPDTLLVRTGTPFSPYDDGNPARAVERALAAGRRHAAPATGLIRPSYTPDLVRAALDLLIDGERGEWTLACPDAMTPFDFARAVASALGMDPALVTAGGDAHACSGPPARGRTVVLPPFADALARHAAERRRLAPQPVAA